MSKRVTVTINTTAKKYERDMEKAKAALLKAREAEIDKGEFTIDHIDFKIENLQGGMM